MTPQPILAILDGANQLGANAVTEIKGPRLVGQGKSLPANFPYEGEWILEPRIFLFRRNDQRSYGSPEITVTLNERGQNWCFGIDSTQLAQALKIESEAIFEHNRAGTLYIVRVDDVAPSPGATVAKQYIFQVGNNQAPMTIEEGLSGTP